MFYYTSVAFSATGPLLGPWRCGLSSGTIMTYYANRYKWRCNGRIVDQVTRRTFCRSTSYALTYDSYFYKRKIASNDVMLILYFWATRVPRMAISQKDTSAVINDWYKMVYHDLCQDDMRIGGEGVVVEIDESKFGKRKYNRERCVEGIWVVGGIERTKQRRCFMKVAENRNALALNEIIRRHILPGSIVHTDCWRAYRSISDLETNLTHRTVNHSESFITPDGVHTNTIEGTWSAIKLITSPRLRTKKMMPWTLMEFIWRRKHHGNIWEGIMKCLREVTFVRNDDTDPSHTVFSVDADEEFLPVTRGQ
ncbi:hypothetical protein [Parasitella parasitica]|uniref:ISXO2-like transposase domain-containing protein n=1 Tax=Parasitella parasitica TaxID=35722 RepID=A0A0B7NCM1_9FUNG|nr:hypothetical protein [Parasitella parasitica]